MYKLVVKLNTSFEKLSIFIIGLFIIIYIIIILYDIFYTEILNRKKINYYLQYISKFYNGRDDSHGIEHVKQVAKIALNYSNSYYFTQNEIKIIIITALLHDAYDHKYIIDINKVKKDINKVLRNLNFTDTEINTIHNIIEDISFSKEKKKRVDSKKEINTFNDNRIQLIRNIVSDADKSTSLGEIAIIRMIQYMNHSSRKKCEKKSMKWYQNHIDHIIKHCNEKLFILLSHNYIRTEIGRYDCLKKENKLRDIISKRDLLINYISKYG